MAPPASSTDRLEFITRGNVPPVGDLAGGVELRVFASGELGAVGLSTGYAVIRAGSRIPWHTHPFGKSITVISGPVLVEVEGRRYQLRPLDSIHIPAETVHCVINDGAGDLAQFHLACASATPTQSFVEVAFPGTSEDQSTNKGRESLVRSDLALAYELAPNTSFRDLFAGRLGAKGICGGVGTFAPGASLPCHFHEFDESITIIEGQAICQVAGREYQLSDCDTACIPRGRPHRFLNRGDTPMTMIWVYAGDEPERTLVDPAYCTEALSRSTPQDVRP